MTASICCRMSAGETSSNEVTPCVFCAVIAVMALVPYTPCAANVLRSAWIPAPAPESLPAIVRAVRMLPSADQTPESRRNSGGGEQFGQVGKDERIHT